MALHFDPKLHHQCPPGWIRGEENDNSQDIEHPRIQTYYIPPQADMNMYGVDCSVDAFIKTNYRKYHERQFGRLSNLVNKRLDSQTAQITLKFDAVWAGYEATESQALATVTGNRWDPEKVKTTRDVCNALKKKLTALGYHPTVCLHDIVVELDNDRKPVFEQFQEINNLYHEVAQRYERGEKPLGDIRQPSGKVRINKRLQQRELTDEERLEEIAENSRQWREQVTGEKAERLTALVEGIALDIFPTGHTVSERDHEVFASRVLTALKDHLSRERE